MNLPLRISALAGAAASAALLAGCVTRAVPYPAGVPVTQMNPDQAGFVSGTGIESQDIVAITDRMAHSILGIREIANARSPLHVVLEPVINNTRFPIDKDIFLTRIRTELNSKSMGKVRFLDREMMEALQRERALQQAEQASAGQSPAPAEIRGADYILTGKLDGLTTKTAEGTSDYVIYSFRLTDARTSEIVWEDSAEIKKQGLEDAAYR
jgi:penicillin-binding protein activator